MKRIAAIILGITALVLVFSMAGHAKPIEYADSIAEEVNTYPNISMELSDEAITLSRMTLKIVNRNSFAVESGNQNDFWVEALREGKWQSIVTKERSNTAEAMVFNEEQQIQVNISSVYGKLPAGHYRVVKCFWPEDRNETDRFFLAAEFDIA